MARITSILFAVSVLQFAQCMHGEAKSKSTRHRLRREASSIEDVPWKALNYTFYSNQNVFLLRDTSEVWGSDPKNLTHPEGLYAEKLMGSPNTRRTLLKVGSGPFWVQEELYPTPADPFNDMSIEAFLLQQDIAPYASSIDVLFRVREENLFTSGSTSGSENGRVKPCFKAMARVAEEMSESLCTPSSGSEYCIAKIPILVSWHAQSRTTTVDSIAVSYVVAPATSLGTCGNANRASSIPQDDGIPAGESEASSMMSEAKEIGRVTLLPWGGDMEAVNEDRYVGLYIPSRRLGIGQHFVIPITINKMYLDGDCTFKAKARNGITAVAVRSTNQDQWNTLSMVKQKGTFAMATAEGLVSTTGGSAADSMEEDPLVFMMEFEVLNDTTEARVINWRVDCNLRGEARASRFGVDIPVSDDWIQAIVPMPQETSIVNTALLTGREASTTLDIGVVTYLGDVMDAAGHARCRSADVDVLKVRRSCANVYVDGTEAAGSESIAVTASLQGHEASIDFSVWVPERPLVVELTDSKLSTIRSWKVAGGRQDEGILEPEKMLNRGSDSNKNVCRLKYQQSRVSVYTRFYAPNANSVSRPDGKRIYLFGENMEQSVTHLVVNQLGIEDRSIARIEGTDIIAKSPGNTIIKVTHPRTRENLGESPLTVAADKVNIAQLQVFLVSGMNLGVQEVGGKGSKVKEASVSALSDLFVEHQEAILNAVLIFDDGTSLPLQDVSTNDYTVGITTLDPDIVLESPDSMQAYPAIIAMGEGSTSILLEIALPKPCMKRRRSSAIAYTVIPMNITFGDQKYADLVAGAADQPPVGSDSLWRSLTRTPGTVDYGIVRVNFDLMDDRGAGGSGGGKKGVMSSIPIDIDFNNIYPLGPGRKGGQNVDGTTAPPGDGSSGNLSDDEEEEKLSGIEIGMYVLLGVFSLAILAFMINCILFMAKYRRSKRVPKTVHGGPQYPQNWVIFGGGAVEEHHHGNSPRILLDPAESIPLRHKDEGEGEGGSSRDEAIGTESEVSIERHGSEEGHRSQGHIEETSLSRPSPEHRLSNDLQDCGVVMDSDDNEEDESLRELESHPLNTDESSKGESGSSSNSESPHLDEARTAAHADSEQYAQEEKADAVAVPSPPLNTNNSCDVQITLNPSDENLYLRSGLEGMELGQILNYLDTLKESCT